MSVRPEPLAASVSARTDGDCLELTLTGVWRMTDARPSWTEPGEGRKPARIRLRAEPEGTWDTSLLLYLFDVVEWCRKAGAACELDLLPERMRALLSQLTASHQTSVPHDRTDSYLTTVGLATRHAWINARGILQFLGECAIGAVRLPGRPHKFRWRDCVDQMQECGPMAVPIVSLISFLVGLTLAYEAAVEARAYGADIYVADAVAISVVREMGPLMAAIILAGRTGAAFAATLGNMKANEEIDALEVLGLSAVDFLVLPRLLALAVVMPLLALYADCVGILGGMVVSDGILQIPPSAYWIETQTSIGLGDINTGLIKAVTYGLLIGLAGCLRGLQAERSAAGVGRAATSAVVTGILLIIVADAVYAVIFHILGV